MVEAKKSAKKSTGGAKARTKNVAQIAEGKVKTVVGKAASNRRLEVKGQLDKAKGKAKQVRRRIKDAVED